MDLNLAKELNGTVQQVRPHVINVADGHDRQTNELCTNFSWLMQGVTHTAELLLIPLRSCDMILGVQWSLPLGDLKMNFQHLTLGFTYQGK